LTTIVSVVGLGYVGLPLAMSAAKAGYQVHGIEIDRGKLDQILSGKSPIEDVSDLEIGEVLGENLSVGSDFSVIKNSSVVVICVPTPLSADRKPDLSFLESAVKSLAPHLNDSSLVILESTVQPGTTRNVLAALIVKHSRHSIEALQLAYSPERIDPLNKQWNLKNTPKIIAGLTSESLVKATNFYSKFVDQTINCESLEVAELAKLLENSFRYVNISFINEFSRLCRSLGVEVNHVINAAATKPYGFIPFYPGVGVGGHCIPVDPLYLSDTALKVGAQTRFIDLADEINSQMSSFFVKLAEDKIGKLLGKLILVVGVSYKTNVSDVRETPVEGLILGLRSKGAIVFWHDDLVSEWKGETSSPLDQKYDLAIIATPHDYLDLQKLGKIPVINTRSST